jgi:hypothetical protein
MLLRYGGLKMVAFGVFGGGSSGWLARGGGQDVTRKTYPGAVVHGRLLVCLLDPYSCSAMLV